MGLRGLLVFFVAASFGAASVSQAAGYKLLLTSFDPFGGSARNNTQPIVAQLARRALEIGTGVSVATCNLPVVYDKAAEVAQECIARIHPDAVISFGEAECALRIETAATNLDDSPGFPDNAGHVRMKREIVPGASERAGFHFPIDSMYCALGSTADQIEVSVSPGSFVCNNVAYHLSSSLSGRGIPFTFIHVPNSHCSPAQKNPGSNARLILPMLRAAVSALRSQSALPSALPIDDEQAKVFLQTLQKTQAPLCQLQFAQRVLMWY